MTRDKWRQLCKDTAEYIKSPLMIHISTAIGFADATKMRRRRWSNGLKRHSTGFTRTLTPEQWQAKLDRTASRKRRLAREAAGLAEGGGG
jgi:hypothetical protein